MKKLLALLIGLLIIQGCSEARDYTKLHQKEMKHSQKYGSTQFRTETPNYVNNYTPVYTTELKDPHLIKVGRYDIIDDAKYSAKLKSEEGTYAEFAKGLKKVNLSNYNAQAVGRDYYRIYRITERIIRANRLDYQVWRIGITREADDINAYSTSGNYINLYTSMVDTFIDNDDALAMVIGHEIAHILLGHQKRSSQTLVKLRRLKKQIQMGNQYAVLSYATLKRKYIIDSKNMEFAADVEGAKLAIKAGYDPESATDFINLAATFDSGKDFDSDHPAPEKRLENFRQNLRYVPTEQYKQWGRYNIYNTNILRVTPSSDRKSIVIASSGSNVNTGQFYHPETTEEMFLRFGYMSYKNREFERALDYFKNLFSINQTNAPAYLYASYAAEELYKQNQNKKFLELSKEYAQKALGLDPNNKYIREQAEAL